MHDPLESPVLHFLTDLARVAFLVVLWAFAIETALLRNGARLRRFADFMMILAVVCTWFSLVYFDARFNVIPWVNVEAVAHDWNWLVYLLFLVALVRLWSELRRRP